MKVVGIVEFKTINEYFGKYRHTKDICSHVSLVYVSAGDDSSTEIEMYKNDDGLFKVLYSYMVKQKYSIEDGRLAFPELFL